MSDKEITSLYKDKSRALAKSNWKEVAELCNFLGNKLCERGKLDEALAEHEEELRLCQQLKDESGCALAHRCIGEVYSEMQDYKKALRSLKVFLQMSEKRKDMVEMQRAWATIGRAYLMKDDLSHAETAFTMALKLADKAKESVKEAEWIEMKCRSYLNLGLIYDQRDDINEGCRYYSLAIQLASKHKLNETLHRCQNSLALFYQKLKLYPRALKLLNDAITTTKTLKNKVFECEYLISKGHLLLLMNNLAAARKSFRKAVHSKSPVDEDRDKALAKYKTTTNICKAMKLLQSLSNDATAGEEETGEAAGRDAHKCKALLRLHDKLGDLFSEAEVFVTAVHHYKQELSLAIEAHATATSIASIHVSIAQTLFDDKQYEEALEFFNKEREFRKGNAVEETRTTLKIIEISIAMGKSGTEIRELYEAALLKFGSEKRCLQKILKDYALYLDQELEIEKAGEIRRTLLQLGDADKRLSSEEEEEEGEDRDNEEEELRLSDISSPSSSSDSEDEEKSSNRYLTNSDGRPKRSRIKKIKTNELGETPLHRACIEGDVKRAHKLLQDGHPINPRDHCGWLPIHEAANHDHADIVRLLVEAGADLNDPGGEKCGGTTPLHDACNNCNVQVIQVLLQMGADACKFDQDGNTPLDCLRNWRQRVKQLSEEEAAVFHKTVQLLEERMKSCGFDLDAERNRPVVQVNLSPDKKEQNRHRAAKLSRRRLCSDSPPSSPSPPLRKKSRKLDRDLDFDDPDVARGEYRAAIKSLRRTRDPGVDFEEEDGGEVADRGRDTALIDASERVDVDDWLVDDMGKQRKGNYRELYESGHLPKKQVSRRTHPATDATTRAHRTITSGTPSASSNSEHSASKACDSGAEADAVQVDVEAEERVVSVRDPVPVLHPADERSDANAKKQQLLISVRVEDKAFLIRVTDERKLVSWLLQETANRYYQLVKKRPVIYLETPEGAILSPDDLIVDVIMGKEVNARVQSFESLPLNVRYQENCKVAGIAVLPELEQLLHRVECNGLLNLSHVLISGEQEKALLDAIAESSRLVSVDLSFRNMATSEQSLLSCLRQSSPQLRELRLSGCGISSQDLTFLVDLSLPVSLLDLSYNSLHDDSCPALCRLILSLQNLTQVYFIACDFTANILHDEKLSHTISTHVTLTQVFVDESLIDDVPDADLLQRRFRNRLQVQKWKKLLPTPRSLTHAPAPDPDPEI